jgi:hypothetical protein
VYKYYSSHFYGRVNIMYGTALLRRSIMCVVHKYTQKLVVLPMTVP